jgi:hypothetical protein
MESGQSFSTCIGMGRDEKARGSGLQLCFGLFVLYKMGCFKDATREVGASERFKKLLEASVTIILGGSNVNPSL